MREMGTRSDAERIIDQSVSFIKENLARRITVELCARHVHLSPNYFAALFKKVKRCTVQRFILCERMECAKLMLLEGRSIQDIAESLSYQERRYFTHAFKQYAGVTPSDYCKARWNEHRIEHSRVGRNLT